MTAEARVKYNREYYQKNGEKIRKRRRERERANVEHLEERTLCAENSDSFIGKKFGHLTPIEYLTWRSNGHYRTGYKCLCDCGNYVERVRTSDLKRGHTTSCGHCNGFIKKGENQMKKKKITQEMLDSMNLEELKKLTDEELASLVGLKIGKHTLTAYVPRFTCAWGKQRKGFITDMSGGNIAQWPNLYRTLLRKQNKCQAPIQPEQPDLSEQPDLPEESEPIAKNAITSSKKQLNIFDIIKETKTTVIPFVMHLPLESEMYAFLQEYAEKYETTSRHIVLALIKLLMQVHQEAVEEVAE